jgi:hypothetical protein
MSAVICLFVGNDCFLQDAIAQAEEIFSQNSTFLQEIEEPSKKNLAPSTIESMSAASVENQTTA